MTLTALESSSPVQILPDEAQLARIHHLLRSHSQPPDHFPSILSTLSEELEGYDVEIADLQERLERLTVERKALRAHYANCQSLLAPIRRLPSETLVEIFDLCWCSFTPAFEDVGSESIYTELRRLARAPLLDLSQVCARWHAIVMGTPSLWATVELAGVLWDSSLYLETVENLVRNLLDRSANYPLVVFIANEIEATPGFVFNLLAEHSWRWRTARFVCQFSDLEHLSAIRGNLPRLELLDLCCWDDGGHVDAAVALDIFQIVPKLQVLVLHGSTESFAVFSELPFEQLNRLCCTEETGDGPPLAMTFAARLRPSTTLGLRLSRLGRFRQVEPSSHAPPVTPDISVLIFTSQGFSPVHARRTVGKILESCTLPSLTELGFTVGYPEEDHPSFRLPWPHPEFLSLSERSSFQDHLLAFDLYRVVITEGQLLESLSSLTTLERLAIANEQDDLTGESKELLITDTLLAALNRNLQTPPLPRLRSFNCRSILQFDDKVYLDFLLSRLSIAHPFECELLWLRDHHR
ncbi:hypothetical protein DFH09DRAFT_1361035 [Mycena vulgaris]|nr:hypothetical protein DFH09DRAFT_1361035 [Mycena vulgaris]